MYSPKRQPKAGEPYTGDKEKKTSMAENPKTIIFGLMVLLVLFLGVPRLVGSSVESKQYLRTSTKGKKHVWGLSSEDHFTIAIVADLDRQSRTTDKKPTWFSYFKVGKLARDKDSGTYSISWEPDITLKTNLGEAGRGLELSELVVWQDKLFTFDDRSGVVFEIDRSYNCIPTYILMEGDGRNSKGQKTEWATVKDGELYIGSFGKEYTNSDGSVKNRNNLWISIISPSGHIRHEDWTRQYNRLRKQTNSEFPYGYQIHEAIHWDDIHRQWYVLPRRVSTKPYDEKVDEIMGSNVMLVADEDFTHVAKSTVGPQIPLRGWSSFKFVPGTNNKIIVALKTEEEEDKDTGAGAQRSYITVFDIEGNELLPQTKIPGDHKFEGVEFL